MIYLNLMRKRKENKSPPHIKQFLGELVCDPTIQCIVPQCYPSASGWKVFRNMNQETTRSSGLDIPERCRHPSGCAAFSATETSNIRSYPHYDKHVLREEEIFVCRKYMSCNLQEMEENKKEWMLNKS